MCRRCSAWVAGRTDPGRRRVRGDSGEEGHGRRVAAAARDRSWPFRSAAATLLGALAALRAQAVRRCDLPAAVPDTRPARADRGAAPGGAVIVVQRAPDGPATNCCGWPRRAPAEVHAADLAEHQPARPDLRGRPRPNDPPHLGLAGSDRDTRKLVELDGPARRLPALVQSAPASDRRSSPGGVGLPVRRVGVANARRARASGATGPRVGSARGGLALLWTPARRADFQQARAGARSKTHARADLLRPRRDCDRLLPWPRAPLAPAVVAVVALTVDALAGTQLLMRSLLGPNPILGARFYGIGNELKSGLAVLVFAAVAAALYPAVRSRRTSRRRWPARVSCSRSSRARHALAPVWAG